MYENHMIHAVEYVLATVHREDRKSNKSQNLATNFPKPNNGIPTNNMVRVMAELTILTSNALEKLEQKRKTMTSRINKLKGKKVVRRLNFNK